MSHVDEGLLHAWLDGGLEPGSAEGAEVAAHLASCADCRARLEEARALREGANQVLRHAAPAEVHVPPFETIRARRANVTAPAAPSRTRKSWLPPVRLAWAASLFIALGAGWMANELFRVNMAMPASRMDAGESVAPQQTQSRSLDDASAAASPSPINMPPAEAKAVADVSIGVAGEREAAGAAAKLAGADESRKVNPATTLPAAVATPARRAEVDSVGRQIAGGAVQGRRLTDSLRTFRPQGQLSLEQIVVTGAARDTNQERARVQANEAARAPFAMAPPPSPAEHDALMQDYAAVTLAGGWSMATPEVVAFQLGRAAAAIDGARLDSTETGVANGRTLIRARYTLDDGARVELIQRATPVADAREARQEGVAESQAGQAAGGAGRGGRGGRAARDEPFMSETVLRLDRPGLTLLLKAALPEDSLRAIATRIR